MPRNNNSADEPLFAFAISKGAFERAAEKQITKWRKAGADIGPSESATLRLAGRAQDIAAAEGKSWAIGDANRTMLAALQAYAPGAAPAGDEWDALAAALAAADADDSAEVRNGPPP